MSKEGADVRGVTSTSWTNLVTDAREGSASWQLVKGASERADEKMGRQLPIPEMLRSKCRVPDLLVAKTSHQVCGEVKLVKARTRH